MELTEAIGIKDKEAEAYISEIEMMALLTDAIKTTEEDRQVNVETVKWELADSEKELQWLKAAFASSEKEHVHIDDVRLELDNERSSRKNLEEELGQLNSIVAEIISETGEAAIQKLQTEIKFCKNILQCSVCTDRPKEVVIVKCYHRYFAITAFKKI